MSSKERIFIWKKQVKQQDFTILESIQYKAGLL